MAIKSRDYIQLHESLGQIYAHLDLDSFPRVALKVACSLVPCHLAAYNEVDPVRRRVVLTLEPDEAHPRVLPLVPIWEKLMHQNPLIRHFQDQPHDGPRRISDFLTQEAFEQTDIYQRVYRHIHGRYQIVTAMPAPSPLLVGIAQNRADRNFTERERDLLDLLRPHLRQAYDNACVVTEMCDKLRQLDHVIDQMDRGIVVLDEAGKVLHCSPASIRHLGDYLPREAVSAHRMPPSIEPWLGQQIATLTRADDTLTQARPMMIDGVRGRLILRLIPDIKPKRFLIVMHEAARLKSFHPLQGLGLTEREAEVLYWCVEGKSAAEIGLLLGISERTIQKHLEHIYAKLEVPNRVAAVTKAVEWLRW